MRISGDPRQDEGGNARLTFVSEALLQLLDLGQRGVLAACSQQVAQRVDSAAAVAALVEQGKCLLVVG